MRIMAIVASPKGIKGATGGLTEIVLEGAASLGAQTEIMAIKGDEVRPCRACEVCHTHGRCPQNDSFAAIKMRIEAADAFILATPNYARHVSAQLKAFIDRCCGVVHLQGFQGKYGVAVVTSAGGREEQIADYLQQFIAFTGAIPVGAVWETMGLAWDNAYSKEKREKAFALGERLVNACNRKEPLHNFRDLALEFRQDMKNLVLSRRESWPYEYEYWKTFEKA
jgi:multimeric flavodoxin WrbA